jgi:hypothetical protein
MKSGVSRISVKILLTAVSSHSPVKERSVETTVPSQFSLSTKSGSFIYKGYATTARILVVSLLVLERLFTNAKRMGSC